MPNNAESMSPQAATASVVLSTFAMSMVAPTIGFLWGRVEYNKKLVCLYILYANYSLIVRLTVKLFLILFH